MGLEIQYSDEGPELLETGGGLAKALPSRHRSLSSGNGCVDRSRFFKNPTNFTRK